MTLASAGSPGPYDLEWIQHFLASSQIREGALQGQDWFVWGRKTKHENEETVEPCGDLVALIPQPRLDWFRTWVAEKLVRWLLNSAPRWVDTKSPRYRTLKDKTLLGWTMAFTSAIASALPILSIVVLYYAKDSDVRLGLLVLFNGLAAFVLTVFTNAQPMQVFAASAAYSAVNVVFVGSNTTAIT